MKLHYRSRSSRVNIRQGSDSSVVMSEARLLSAWWMPEVEEALWEVSRLSATRKVIFLTGIFTLMSSIAHSLVLLFFQRNTLSRENQVLIPYRIVEWTHSVISLLISVGLFWGYFEDSAFVKHRVFCFGPTQDLLSAVNSGFSIYSIGNTFLNLQTLRRDRSVVCLLRGGLILGMNYLNLIYPCVLGARLRVYWNLMEIAVLLSISCKLAQYLYIVPKTIITLSILALLLCLVRFWISAFLLMWSYQWVSAEALWNVPDEVSVSQLTATYLTGLGFFSLGLSYFAFYDFQMVVQITKEWSDKYKQRTRTER